MTNPISPPSYRQPELSPRQKYAQRARELFPNAQNPIQPLVAPKSQTNPQNEGSTNTNLANQTTTSEQLSNTTPLNNTRANNGWLAKVTQSISSMFTQGLEPDTAIASPTTGEKRSLPQVARDHNEVPSADTRLSRELLNTKDSLVKSDLTLEQLSALPDVYRTELLAGGTVSAYLIKNELGVSN